MTSYRIPAGAELSVRVDDGVWQTVRLPAGETTAKDLAELLSDLDGVRGEVRDDALALVSDGVGETALLRVAGSGAAALGLAQDSYAEGLGPGSARLTGRHEGPFTLPRGASMTVHVDGLARKVAFGEATERTAAEVCAAINARLRRVVARPTADGRVQLTSPTTGVGSRLSVTAPADAAPDAAAVLGFTGDASHAEPYRTLPARLVCRPAADTTVVENLTSAPIELQLPTGRLVLPARGRLVLARDTAADALLQRLTAQGAVRMSPERNT